MSNQRETYGKGGAGNVGASVNHGVESLRQHVGSGGSGVYQPSHHPAVEHGAGRGGVGNIHDGEGHYDATGGHHVTDTAGRGGYGNVSEHVPAPGTHATTGTTEGTAPFKETGGHTVHKVTATDKVIGAAEIAIGKVTKNTGLVEKGIERKTEGSQHTTVPPPGAPTSGAPNMFGPSAEIKNRAI